MSWQDKRRCIHFHYDRRATNDRADDELAAIVDDRIVPFLFVIEICFVKIR